MKLLRIVWTLPYTLLGIVLGLIVLATGGRARWGQRAIEFSGGAVRCFFRCLPRGRFIQAMTLGHTILAVDEPAMNATRQHEWVHVAQFERWGLFMGPAYLLVALWLWLQGKDPYWDNPFEREAWGDDRP
ncbi:MAG: hypothetical protein KatS3mg110_1108 [Pirellulaceae bacterium]|nr:MAG: hypothetical protein KatS3mg110_1108 [Pirellulaceae bacterium]